MHRYARAANHWPPVANIGLDGDAFRHAHQSNTTARRSKRESEQPDPGNAKSTRLEWRVEASSGEFNLPLTLTVAQLGSAGRVADEL